MKLKRKIHKDKWTIEIVSLKTLQKVSGNDYCTGLCLDYEKTIYIREDSITYDVIAHELYHAYWSYLYLSDTENITLDDAEEIAANFFAAEGEAMVKIAKKITKDLQKLYERENE